MPKSKQLKPFPVRLPPEVRKIMETKAKENCRTLSSEILFCVMEACRKYEKEQRGNEKTDQS